MKIEPRNPEAASKDEEDKKDKEAEQEEKEDPVSITEKYLKEYWSRKGLKYWFWSHYLRMFGCI